MMDLAGPRRRRTVWIEAVHQALRQIRAYALRSALTTAGIVIAVTGVITVTAVMQGLESGVNRALHQLGSDHILVSANFRKVMSGSPTRALGFRQFQALATQVQGLTATTASLSVGISGDGIRHLDRTATGKVLAVSAHWSRLYQALPEAGRHLLPSDDRQRLRVCLITSEIAQALALGEAPVGKFIQIGGMRAKVVGVLPSWGKASLSSQLADVYLPLSVGVEMSGESDPGLDIGFRVESGANREAVLRDVAQTLRQSFRAQPGEEDDFRIESAEELRRTNRAIIGMVSLVLLVVVSISLIVGGVGVMNVMLVSVTERTQEIGILRALGATRRDIQLQFLLEAALLCAVGAVAGIVLGWVLAQGLVLLIPHADSASVPAWAIFGSTTTAVGVGLLAGAMPASMAARLDPVEALSKE